MCTPTGGAVLKAGSPTRVRIHAIRKAPHHGLHGQESSGLVIDGRGVHAPSLSNELKEANHLGKISQRTKF